MDKLAILLLDEDAYFPPVHYKAIEYLTTHPNTVNFIITLIHTKKVIANSVDKTNITCVTIDLRYCQIVEEMNDQNKKIEYKVYKTYFTPPVEPE
jgi:hypothetical protein